MWTPKTAAAACSCYLQLSHWVNNHDRLICVRRQAIAQCRSCKERGSAVQQDKWGVSRCMASHIWFFVGFCRDLKNLGWCLGLTRRHEQNAKHPLLHIDLPDGVVYGGMCRPCGKAPLANVSCQGPYAVMKAVRFDKSRAHMALAFSTCRA